MAEASEEELPELYKDEIEAIQKSSKKSPTSGNRIKYPICILMMNVFRV